MSRPRAAERRRERDRRLAEIGPMPPWWRFLARRRWKRERAAIMAIDVSELADVLADIYTPEAIEAWAREPAPFAQLTRAAPPGPLVKSVSFGEIVEREVSSAHAAIDARERALDEHGYGAPRPAGEVVGLADFIPTGFVRTPSGVMHAVNHQALVQQARIAGARGILKLLFPAEPVENPFAGISAEEAASFTPRSKP